MTKKMRKLYMLGTVGLLFLMLFFALLPSVKASAATNKAARISVAFDGKQEKKDGDWDKHVYSIDAWLPKTMKVKAGMTVTYKLYIPATLLKKAGTSLDICMDLILLSKNKKGYTGVGSINKSRWLTLENQNGKLTASVYNETLDKPEKFSKYGTLKKSGKYYIVTMKDVLGKYYYDYKTQTDKKINTKTAYTIIQSLVIHGNGKFSGTIYLDEYSTKASRTQKITFSSTKEYNNLSALYWGGKDWTKKLKIVKL